MKRKNFGRNLLIEAEAYCEPRSEAELVDFLNDKRGSKIRCVGRLHSWSNVLGGADAIVNLRNFCDMELTDTDSGGGVRVGAGCQLKQVVSFLNQRNLTLPTLGLIDEQSIAGAISTGTHGSGRHSLSHYVQAVQIACFDEPSGEIRLRWIRAGDAETLAAARCALGCLGVIVRVELPTRKQYNIQEHFQRYETLDDVLSSESTYDLQQFYFAPWRWNFFAQHRVETNGPRSWHAFLYRAFWIVCMDTILHIWICSCARWLPSGLTKFSFRRVIPRLIPVNWKVTDRSDRQLTMQHELFRHIEVEMFVPARFLNESLELTRELIETYADKLGQQRYVHHYPICIRRVLQDDTLVSPASWSPELDKDESWYTISCISYARADSRESFEKFATELTESLMEKCSARPHWGKFCSVNRQQLQRAYPNWTRFCEIVRQMDPQCNFVNNWLDSLMGPSGDERSGR